MTLTKELEEQLKVQRDKLLDLSGRNSLIDFKFKVKENARSQNYLRIVDEVPELIIDKLNVDKRFEIIPNKKDKDKDDYEPYELDLKLNLRSRKHYLNIRILIFKPMREVLSFHELATNSLLKINSSLMKEDLIVYVFL